VYIYVDESGTFAQPRQANKVSVVVAVVIPEAQRRSLLRALAGILQPADLDLPITLVQLSDLAPEGSYFEVETPYSSILRELTAGARDTLRGD
jgi:hypothetical protein